MNSYNLDSPYQFQQPMVACPGRAPIALYSLFLLAENVTCTFAVIANLGSRGYRLNWGNGDTFGHDPCLDWRPIIGKIHTRHLSRALGYATAEVGLTKPVHRHDSVL